MNKFAHLILDLDGVILSMRNDRHLTSVILSHTFDLLNMWKDRYGQVLIATNRTSTELQSIAYFLNLESGIHITENGGVLFDLSKKKPIFPHKLHEYVYQHVPKLRNVFVEKFNVLLSANSGYIRTVVEVPENIQMDDFANSIILPALLQSQLSALFEVRRTKILSIEPKGVDKADSLPEFLRLNQIEPKHSKLFFVADSDRDINLARSIHEIGGIVGAVGNSTPTYADFISRTLLGIVAPPNTSYQTSLHYLINQFIKTSNI